MIYAYGLIKDFPNYVIRNDGVIINIERKREMKHTIHINCKTGYKSFVCGLRHDGKQKSHIISRLLGKAFIFGESDKRNSIDHIDQNPLNNDLINLRWATKTEQNMNRTMPLGVLNEKYISKNKKGFRFQIKQNGKTHTKILKTIEEAMKYKDSYMTNDLKKN